MAGIALAIATIKSENGPAKLQKEATTRADVPARNAAVLRKPLVPPPISPVDVSQPEEKALPFGSLADLQAAADNGPPAVAVPAQKQTLAEPLSTLAPIEPEKMKADLVRSDDAPVRNVALPQANVIGIPLPPPRPEAAGTRPKMAARVEKTLKPAGSTQSGGQQSTSADCEECQGEAREPFQHRCGEKTAFDCARFHIAKGFPLNVGGN